MNLDETNDIIISSSDDISGNERDSPSASNSYSASPSPNHMNSDASNT